MRITTTERFVKIEQEIVNITATGFEKMHKVDAINELVTESVEDSKKQDEKPIEKSTRGRNKKTTIELPDTASFQGLKWRRGKLNEKLK